MMLPGRVSVTVGVAPDASTNSPLSPKGRLDNSPTFQRWIEVSVTISPEGTAEVYKPAHPLGNAIGAGARGAIRHISAVPAGRRCASTIPPNVETLGYCRLSLRDRGNLIPQIQVSVKPGILPALRQARRLTLPGYG
jgi:hypothetical protein